MYKVGIVGLGNIAHAYSKPEDPYPYCHAGGAKLSKRVKVTAVADLDAGRREEYNKLWGPAKLYDDGQKMFEQEDLDIIAICVRGPLHEKITLAALKSSGAKVIFLEKPAGCSLKEVDNIHKAAAKKGVLVVVSHSRHWGPHVLRMAELIEDGLVGDVQTVIGYCQGGPLSFSVHEIDMICQFAGYNPISVAASTGPSTKEEKIPNGYEQEPVVLGAVIRYKSGVTGVHVGGGTSSAGAFCVDVFGSNGRAFVPFYGVPKVWTGKGKEEKAVDIATLNMPEKASPFLVAYEQIADYLDTGKMPDCGPEMYRPVNEIAFGMIESGIRGETIPLPCKKRYRLIFANG
ncbi:MAG: Gfo/Idh/MocA family oxidoreductase [Planctomycetota bacterium]